MKSARGWAFKREGLHAKDLAGNATNTTLTFTLDYSGDTNPPVLEVDWPRNGDYLSGTNFTISGRLDDPTANRDSTWEVPLYPSNEVSTLDWANGSGGLGTDGEDGETNDKFFWPVVWWPQWESPGVTW